MREIQAAAIEQAVYDLILEASYNIGPDVCEAVRRYRDAEPSPTGRAVLHQHNGFNGDRSRTAEWIPKQYVVMQTCVDDQRRRKSFTQRGNVCLRAVAALVQRSAGGVYHQCRIVLEYEKFDLIFYSGFRHTHKTVF